uniref:Microbial-type PARG catalytic domain-containing protein n=1 Tax=Percolomonas cosmopolitus TaxID=63605 RepID=A0A7S1KNR8_9EUKA|mmetsp:Transcript_3230/g.12334  ORF Transcript_3230/g.12334 Transcript_3230/m.12334 type:complete len:127 (+) Transcript_3230:628-1008(+)
MANEKRPGCSYRKGSAAQEENLCRRSNLFQCLDDMESDLVMVKYPIAEFGGIYSPKVLFFRSSEQTGYRFLPKKADVNVLTVAAYRRPKLEEHMCSDGSKVQFLASRQRGPKGRCAPSWEWPRLGE